MTVYSFEDTLNYFSNKIGGSPPEEDLEEGKVELSLDPYNVLIEKGNFVGSLAMKITLGVFIKELEERKMKELATANFLGTNTGGCTLALDEEKTAITLKCQATAATTPEENWQLLHRLLAVANEWSKILRGWEEFISFVSKEEVNES